MITLSPSGHSFCSSWHVLSLIGGLFFVQRMFDLSTTKTVMVFPSWHSERSLWEGSGSFYRLTGFCSVMLQLYNVIYFCLNPCYLAANHFEPGGVSHLPCTVLHTQVELLLTQFKQLCFKLSFSISFTTCLPYHAACRLTKVVRTGTWLLPA
ncbi:MAG: hypothetical protein CM1200mP18_12220 [Gammaproteobacteria bacterium]|nr:MAG: hypothetical protein CM1200mP18_12220 [Gammaproteobacteria bacterium]